ncbi:hypothetical protein Fmac_031615 [Flemingia macrophylla]|uniref:Uncharacterized protein n=1 Tax=Flemingia macrophylla TaxID=520843 RepID=A0ABD1L2J6_9FABA
MTSLGLPHSPTPPPPSPPFAAPPPPPPSPSRDAPTPPPPSSPFTAPPPPPTSPSRAAPPRSGTSSLHRRSHVGSLQWELLLSTVAKKQLRGQATPVGDALRTGFALAEAYVTRKIYMEKLKIRAQEEKQEGEKTTNMKISTIETASQDQTSTGCFSWVSKQHHHHHKISPLSHNNVTQVVNS